MTIKDIAAHISGAEVKLKERWKYVPLVFATPTSTKAWTETNMEIYPNPAYDVLNINIKSLRNTTNLLAHIINADGKVVSELSLQKEINNIDISALNSGVYTVKVMDNKQIVFVSKFIKIQ